MQQNILLWLSSSFSVMEGREAFVVRDILGQKRDGTDTKEVLGFKPPR